MKRNDREMNEPQPMEMENMGHHNCGCNGGQMFFAFLGGALVGATAALLLAPQSGRETRQQLKGLAENAKEAMGRVPEALQNATLAAKEAISK